MKKSVFCGIYGGIVLYIPLILVSYLPYIEKQILLLPLMIVGAAIVTSVILYKNLSFKHAILRTFLMFVCCLFIARLCTTIGLIRLINYILCITITEAGSRSSGLGMVLYLLITFFACVITNSILLIVAITKKYRGDKGTGGQEDSSLVPTDES